MKDPSNEVIKAFYSELNGKTTLTPYTMVPSGVDDYIFIGDFTTNGDIAKDKYITDNTVTVEIVKTYRGQGTKTAVNADANIVLQNIRDAFASTVALTGFTVIVTTWDGSNDFVEETDEFKIFRKFVRFRLIIEEN